MATKDISDLQVVQAYAEMAMQHAGTAKRDYADDILARATGQPHKVCERAMERAHRHGLIECGMWLRGGWLTETGVALLKSAEDATDTKPH